MQWPENSDIWKSFLSSRAISSSAVWIILHIGPMPSTSLFQCCVNTRNTMRHHDSSVGRQCIYIYDSWNDYKHKIIHNGAIHLWRPHGGKRCQAQVDACGRGEEGKRQVDILSHPHRKLHWRHPIFSSCKEVGVYWTRISSLDGIKSRNFLSI